VSGDDGLTDRKCSKCERATISIATTRFNIAEGIEAVVLEDEDSRLHKTSDEVCRIALLIVKT